MSKFKNILFFFLLLFVVSSCTQYKKIIYLQHKETKSKHDSIKENKFFIKQNVDYKIQKNDILYIKILNPDKNNFVLFNTESPNSNRVHNEVSLFLEGNKVDNYGYISMPVIGKVKVIEMTIEEIKEKIHKLVDGYLNNSTVIVKLISFKITLIGEVSRPGVYNIYEDNISVLQAIGKAGDMTDYGDRKNIIVVRANDTGTKTYKIDLTNINLLSSEAYYLMPGDIVYVQPIKAKTFRTNIPTYSLFLSILTTFVLLLNYIKY
ncbi:MAG: polysaccharide biosynthesis/export family protein [Bacteroidetes bacterium]|nr:polysaccharide biosynthesis/export family protein [Bacteroidota bacterium]